MKVSDFSLKSGTKQGYVVLFHMMPQFNECNMVRQRKSRHMERKELFLFQMKKISGPKSVA
jgi:hypothetical protein